MSEKTDIWFLIGGLGTGGTARTVIQLVNNLPRDRFQIRLFTIHDDIPLYSKLDSSVEFECLDARNKLDMVTAGKFVHRIAREKPNILQSFLFFDNILARVAGIVSPSTTVISGIRMVPREQSALRTYLDILTVPLADYIVSNSNAGANWLTTHGVPSDDIVIIRNCLDLSPFMAAEAPESMYRELNIEEGPVIGIVARLTGSKGHVDLLDAWPKILEEYASATLLIVGDGPERGSLERKSEGLDCRDSIRFTGFRDDVPELLDIIDVFAFPSYYEGLPSALIEAMAAGVPCVATPVDGNRELIEDGETGLLTPLSSPNALADRICQVLADPDLAETLSSNAIAKIENEFTRDQVLDDYVQFYDRISRAR